MPPCSLDIAFVIRIGRVSAFLPEVTQHIHSLRAKGVISCHNASAALLEAIALRKSAGNWCTVPPAMLVAIGL